MDTPQAPLPAPELQNIKILLASNSPRRRELMGLILPQFDIAPSRLAKEEYPATLAAESVPAFLSQQKAEAYAPFLHPDEIIITADTVVILDGKILGKPRSHADAVAMLSALSGSTHTVVTGVTLTSLQGKRRDTFSVSTLVHFAAMSHESIEEYVERFKPFDKAGAYGIQEWIGAAFIEGIDGCYYNVMGLPLHALYNHLSTFMKA